MYYSFWASLSAHIESNCVFGYLRLDIGNWYCNQEAGPCLYIRMLEEQIIASPLLQNTVSCWDKEIRLAAFGIIGFLNVNPSSNGTPTHNSILITTHIKYIHQPSVLRLHVTAPQTCLFWLFYCCILPFFIQPPDALSPTLVSFFCLCQSDPWLLLYLHTLVFCHTVIHFIIPCGVWFGLVHALFCVLLFSELVSAPVPDSAFL